MKADYRKGTIENQFAKWENKPMHGQYLTDIEVKAGKITIQSGLRSSMLK